jgi:hypothetical protein
MTLPRKSPPKKRNLAAKALRSPLFRPKVAGNPNAYKRRRRYPLKPLDGVDDEPMN